MPEKLSTKQILNRHQNRRSPFAEREVNLILHNIRSKHNVGSAFRTADAFGVNAIILSGYTPTPPQVEISKTALGAEQNVTWHHFGLFTEILTSYPKSKYQYIGLEQTTDSIEIHDLTLADKAINLIFGNEVTGIDEDLIPHIDTFTEIAQFGTKHSLNVSVCLGITLYAIFSKCLPIGLK